MFLFVWIYAFLQLHAIKSYKLALYRVRNHDWQLSKAYYFTQ